METSTEIIEKAKQRFAALKHKGYDWKSFYNGFLEAKAMFINRIENRGSTNWAFLDDEDQFQQLNFIRKEWLDKDGKDDKFYTLKFVQYEKQIGHEATAIVVCYGYKTEDGENYKLFETSCELRIGTDYLKINTDKVYKLRELYKIITGQPLL